MKILNQILLILIVLGLSTITSYGQKPNIIFIMMDDVSAIDFSFYNSNNPDKKVVVTPTIDFLANDGLVFETAFSQAVCGPTRAELLTAKYANKTGHWGNGKLPDPSVSERDIVHDDNYTMGQVMHDAGYRTAWFGKQHHQRGKNPDQFGFDYYAICKWFPGSTSPSQWHPSQGKIQKATDLYSTMWYDHPAILANGTGVPTTVADWGPEIEVDSMLTFLTQPSSDPFFVYWPTNLPHAQRDPSDPNGTFLKPLIPETDACGEHTGSTIPNSREYEPAVEYVDAALNKIMKTLEETGQLKNTIIFVTSDNGRGSYGKNRYDNQFALRVPFIVYGPDLIVPSAQSTSHLIDFTDIIPTFADLAGYSSPLLDDMDGTSFAPYLRGESFTPREWISAQHYRSDSSYVARWLRTDNWLLDGAGDLWDCSSGPEEGDFVKVTDFTIQANQDTLDHLQQILDQNIPDPLP
ncbi:MAG: sulfatase-like hydrolase/transferase [Cyclobacteriaceae bacterium]